MRKGIEEGESDNERKLVERIVYGKYVNDREIFLKILVRNLSIFR